MPSLFQCINSKDELNQTIYNPTTQLPLDQKFWWEGFGMFFLIMLICNINIAYGFDFWIASILPVAIMLSVKQSGAHYNPSMTLSNFFIKFSPTPFNAHFMWNYFKADLVPAFIAFSIAYYSSGYYFPSPLPGPELSHFQIIISQLIGTFMLVVFLQKIANSQTTFTTSDICTYNFVVVFVYVARKFAVLSGNNINPVANLGWVLAQLFHCHPEFLYNFYLYLLGDFLGSCLGTWFYNAVLEPALRFSRIERAQKDPVEMINIGIQIVKQIERDERARMMKIAQIPSRESRLFSQTDQDIIYLLKDI